MNPTTTIEQLAHLTPKERDIIQTRKNLVREKPIWTGDPQWDPGDLLVLPNLPPELQERDADLRRRWAIVTAHIICCEVSPFTLSHLVAAGFDEFERVFRPQLEGHAFKMADFKLMYELVRIHLAKQLGMTVAARKVIISTGA